MSLYTVHVLSETLRAEVSGHEAHTGYHVEKTPRPEVEGVLRQQRNATMQEIGEIQGRAKHQQMSEKWRREKRWRGVVR